MWEALWLLGATPEGLASELPDLSLLEIAAELKKAEYRVKQRRCHERELARLYEPVVEDRLEAAVNNQLRSGFASRVPA